MKKINVKIGDIIFVEDKEVRVNFILVILSTKIEKNATEKWRIYNTYEKLITSEKSSWRLADDWYFTQHDKIVFI